MKARVAKALRDAKELMNDSGVHWVRWDLRVSTIDPETDERLDEYSYCSLGAILQVTDVDLDKIVTWDIDDGYVYVSQDEFLEEMRKGDFELQTAVAYALREAILASGHVPPDWNPPPQDEYLRSMWTITDWNDSRTRTWEEVAAIFEAAAQRVEATT